MKKLMTIFGAILFASLILTSCGGGTNNKEVDTKESTLIVSDADKIVTEKIPEKDIINLTTFSSIPDELDGCSCIFSESKSEYDSSHFLYFDDMGTTCLISVDNKVIVLKPKNITAEIAEYSNDEYTVYIKDKKSIGSEYENEYITGELVVKNKNGTVVTKKVYGNCGC